MNNSKTFCLRRLALPPNRDVFSILLILLLGLGLSPAAHAATPSPQQRQCIVGLQLASAQVAEAAAVRASRCMALAARGAIGGGDVAACLAAPSRALQRAQAKASAVAKRRCGDAPAFGPAAADTVNSAFDNLVDTKALFGGDLANALKTKASDAGTARCQLAVTQQVALMAKAGVEEYGRCARRRLASGQVGSALDLQVCSGVESTELRKVRRRAEVVVARQCSAVPAQTALPGQCAGSTSSAELAACLTAQARCGSCTAINRADRLSASCHTFEKGVAVQYCGERPVTGQSVARQWDEQILGAIRIDTPRPPIHARNLYHLSAAMYDAWAAYDGTALAAFKAEHPASTNPERDREIAISFAAYRILMNRYAPPNALNTETSQSRFNALMEKLGLDVAYQATSEDGPAAVGNRIAEAVIAAGSTDGSNQAGNYADPTYQPVNKPLVVKEPYIDLINPAFGLNPNRWQPLALERALSQNGIPIGSGIQTFIAARWNGVRPFAIAKNTPEEIYLDPGSPPQLGGLGDAQVKADALQLIEMSSQLTPDDPARVEISPAILGNNPLGSNAGTGYPVNPVTGRPYAPVNVKRGDFARVLAEYWADGPTSETPPGHWNSLANAVADHPSFTRRFGGTGPVLAPLEWDVKTYFALNGALHDAAIACWGAKRKYDGVRPITLIRYMAQLGQSSSLAQPSYNERGLPLKPGVVEVITAESSAPGARHADLVTAAAGGKIGDIAIRAWPGVPADTKTQYSGVRWVLGKSWLPYQRATFVTPAFPGYISGHSTFSRAAAEVLTAMTGSPYFPGGLYEGFVAKKDAYLIHEKGPSEDVHLQWTSYFDAADQAGQSRLLGGIHVQADDFAGRRVGHEVGLEAFARAASHFRGGR